MLGCVGYIAGGIRIVPYRDGDFLNYVISGKDISLEGKIDKKIL